MELWGLKKGSSKFHIVYRYFTTKADKVLHEDFKGFTLISSESSILMIENQENCLLPSLVLIIDPFSLEIIFELDVMLYTVKPFVQAPLCLSPPWNGRNLGCRTFSIKNFESINFS